MYLSGWLDKDGLAKLLLICLEKKKNNSQMSLLNYF